MKNKRFYDNRSVLQAVREEYNRDEDVDIIQVIHEDEVESMKPADFTKLKVCYLYARECFFTLAYSQGLKYLIIEY